MNKLLGIVVAVALLALPALAHAFCGFYVSGADTKLYNNATQVVMMRHGTTTVLSMRNNYQGPPEGFAMVVPVPVVLKKEEVKTLPDEVFERVDKLSAPRLVEYWEMDPCYVEPDYDEENGAVDMASAPVREAPAGPLGVKIEAKFDVGEYNVVILSASDSAGLETWLKQEKYAIPDGAGPYLKPYIEGGSKFFVAKVDPKKVTFKGGQAMLSPLRFHYDSKDFALPVRLGLMNSSGKQDLIVNILAPGQRYHMANFPNVTIPTNINVQNSVRERFGEFYAALFDRTLEKTPGAVVTEYAWDASGCDPCPEPALEPDELHTLGLDVISAQGDSPGPGGFVLTRLHARYSADQLSEDLVFAAAPPIVGGREFMAAQGQVEQGAKPDSENAFQGRYVIRHEWEGPIKCDNPVRGRWGGPPPDKQIATGPLPATDLAFVERGKTTLAEVVAQDIPEIGLTAGKPADEAPAGKDGDKAATGTKSDPAKKAGKKGCGCQSSDQAGFGALLFAAVLVAIRRKKGWTR
jgi:MYXO-CTERM domain-containing protein